MIYREEILEHWQNPQNFGKMRGADLVIDQVNPLCGDQLKFFIKFDDSRSRIKNVRFTGNGCAISVAATSILSEAIKGKKVEVVNKITGADVLKFLGGSVAPARLKCAFLALEVIKKLKVED